MKAKEDKKDKCIKLKIFKTSHKVKIIKKRFLIQKNIKKSFILFYFSSFLKNKAANIP